MQPFELLRPKRKILGISAVLLPFTRAGEIDWGGFSRHLQRTAEAGLVPAVNMDTGYVNLLTDSQRSEVLARTRSLMAGQWFVAGAFVGDRPGDSFDADAYKRQMAAIQSHGGTPVIFQSFGLTADAGVGRILNPSRRATEDAEASANGLEIRSPLDGEIVQRYVRLAAASERFIAFELGTMFAPFGRIYDLETYSGLMDIPQCLGAKHSSLSRDLEWQRIELRDRRRPDFHVFTGNDLAIDMVMYGSDYLLGLSSFAPDVFARRDRYWEAGDPRFFELNDVLQYLGFFGFRDPVPAYKHSAAQFLKLRGWLDDDSPHPAALRRPESDLPILAEIVKRLQLESRL